MRRTISLRHIAGLLCSLSLAACGGDDEEDPGPTAADPDSVYQGSCDFPAAGTCSDYGYPQATAQSSSECASSGGTWSEVQCEPRMRYAVCLDTQPSTRTFAYTAEAVAMLQSTCPAEKFKMLMPIPTGGAGGDSGSGGMSGSGGASGTGGTGGMLDEDAGM
jgi:hypothetical protein